MHFEETHSGEESNKCGHCDFASILASTLRMHLQRHSGEKSNATCVTLHQSRQGNLRTHLKTQGGEKENKCDQCDFTSIKASTLRRHLQTHTGEKSNKCSHCDFACSDPSSLRKHMKRCIPVYKKKGIFLLFSFTLRTLIKLI